MYLYIYIDIKNLRVTLLSKKKGTKEYSWYDSIYIKQFTSVLGDGRISVIQYVLLFTFYIFFQILKEVFKSQEEKNQAIFMKGKKPISLYFSQTRTVVQEAKCNLCFLLEGKLWVKRPYNRIDGV